MSPARLAFTAFALLSLAACAFQRADDAAAAQKRMIGMTREDVLACMGPAKKKSSEGSTEVWSYLSTDGRGDSTSSGVKATDFTSSTTSVSGLSSASTHTRSFCTVNVVMVGGVVKRVNYNGPTSSYWLTGDDQCGYAVANCVDQNKDEGENP